jgi:hypothetical protein
MHGRGHIALLVALLFVQVGAAAQLNGGSRDVAASDWITGTNLASPPDLPVLGKWMLTANGVPARWMGQTYEGKHLREPINVIIVDQGAASASQARRDLLAGAAAAGYPVRMGHSTGYQAYLLDQVHPQIPRGWDDALSDEPFEFSNNHGRLFGPYETSGGYVFVGAFSREEVDLLRWPGHQYASFNKARDDFAKRMGEGQQYRLLGSVSVDNAILDDSMVSTGDHDGKAVLLKVVR